MFPLYFTLSSTVIIAEFEQVNSSCAWETIVSDNEFAFSDCEKCIVLWAGTVCWATNFHNYSPNIELRKDNSVTKIFVTELQKDKLNPDFVQLESCHCNMNNKRRDTCMKETFNVLVRFSTLSKIVIKTDFVAIWVLSGRMIVLTK